MTFSFRLFQKSFSNNKCIKFICVIFTKLSHFIFLRVSVFIRNSSEKSTTSIYNFPNIYCAYIPSTFEKFQTSFMLYCRQSTDESDSVYLQNQIRLSAGTMGEGLAVFRIWNLSVLKQKKRKKLIIGYHLPLSFLPCLNAKIIVSLSKYPTHRKTMPGSVQDIFRFNMVVVINIWYPWTREAYIFQTESVTLIRVRLMDRTTTPPSQLEFNATTWYLSVDSRCGLKLKQ